MRRQTAAAVVFGASAAVLVLEILALRMLAPYVGLTLETSTTVIGVVLAGIAVGSWAGGALADRENPHGLLAGALVLGGLLAMLTVPVVRLLGDAFEGAQEGAALPVALAAFFLPAAVLSTVTPVTAKLQLSDLAATGSVVGRLSAWATAGALTGTFVTGFVLVPAFPTSATVLAVGGALVVAGLVAGARARVVSRAVVAAVIVTAVLAVAAPVALGDRCDAESIYFCAEVEVDESRPTGRILVLDDIQNSYVDLEDPTYLGFDYARWIAPSLTGRRAVVFIGGGGFTLPRWLAATSPGSRSRVLELDRDLLGLARDRLGLGDVPGMSVRAGDARLTLRDEPTDSAEVVVGDAFGGRTVPWHLTTREFLRDVRRVLRPDGIYAMNLIDQGPQDFARAQTATFLDGFDHVALIGHRRRTGDRPGGGNIVLLASDRAIPDDVLPRERGVLVLDTAGARGFAGDADVLRDEHAPTDQLLSPRP